LCANRFLWGGYVFEQLAQTLGANRFCEHECNIAAGAGACEGSAA